MAKQLLGVAATAANQDVGKGYVDALVAANAAPATYQTSNTQGTDGGKWTKFATMTVPTQFLDIEALLRFLSAGDGSGTNGGAYAELRLRVKQQAAFGSNPIVDVAVVQSNGQLNFDDFTAVVTSNAGPTTVDFYLNIDVTYRYWTFNQLNLANGGGSIAYYSNQPFLATLPTGILQQQAINEVAAYPQLLSPTLTGTPVAPTAAVRTNTTQVATTAYVFARTPLITVGTTAPGSPQTGDLWVDTN